MRRRQTPDSPITQSGRAQMSYDSPTKAYAARLTLVPRSWFSLGQPERQVTLDGDAQH